MATHTPKQGGHSSKCSPESVPKPEPRAFSAEYPVPGWDRAYVVTVYAEKKPHTSGLQRRTKNMTVGRGRIIVSDGQDKEAAPKVRTIIEKTVSGQYDDSGEYRVKEREVFLKDPILLEEVH